MTPGQQLLTFKQRLLNAVAASRNIKHDGGKDMDNDDDNEKVSTETAIVEDSPKQVISSKTVSGLDDKRFLLKSLLSSIFSYCHCSSPKEVFY